MSELNQKDFFIGNNFEIEKLSSLPLWDKRGFSAYDLFLAWEDSSVRECLLQMGVAPGPPSSTEKTSSQET